MTLEPLLNAPIAIKIHMATVIPVAILGAWMLAAPKGTPTHKALGKIWLILMVITCISTFFIHEIRLIGDFSPIHILSAWVILGSYQAYRFARQGNIRAHRREVASMYLGGVVGAGIFTFFPGRVNNRILLGGYDFVSMPALETIAMAFLVIGLFAYLARIAWLAYQG